MTEEKIERAIARTDPIDPKALERDAEAVMRVLIREWGDAAPFVAAKALELARVAVSNPAAYRAALARRPPSPKPSGGGGPRSGAPVPVENPPSSPGTAPESRDPEGGSGVTPSGPLFAALEGDR